MMPPCGGCPDRSVGCHGSCERYQAFNAERELIRRRRSDEGELLKAFYDQRKRQKYKKNQKKMR